MKMPHLRSLVLALSLFTLHISLFSSAAAVEDPKLDKILKAHVDAMGGWRAWNKVESIRLTGTIERDGQAVDFCIIKKRPNQIRATITMPIPGNDEEFVQLIRAHDGEKAWTATRLEGGQEFNQQPLDEAAAKELLDEAAVLPKLIDVWQDGAELELVHSNSDRLNTTVTITAKPKGSEKHYRFTLDSKSHHLMSYTVNKEDDTTFVTLKEYRKINGVLIPMISQTESKLTGNSLIATTSAQVGVGIYEEYFSCINYRN